VIKTIGAAVGALIVLLFLATVATHLTSPDAAGQVTSTRP
jgi:hypothetical protein